ncbi:MAG: hypothetical protein ACKV2Q_18890 [Planctomycetaceae bacterium]
MMRKDCWFVLSGMLCLFATGCFSHGPYGHPGAYLPPSTAMVPQPYGMVQTPPGTAWVPASPTSPAGTSSVSAPEPARRAAPTSFGDDSELDSNNAVPTPTDLKKTPLPVVDPTNMDEDASIERPGVRTSQRSRPQPLIDDEFADESEPDGSEPVLAADEFKLPTANSRSANFNTQVRSNNVVPAGANNVVPAAAVNDKYGYDSESYSWLKGVIEFDTKRKVWHLTYSQNPDDTDQFGGEVTLKNTADFKYLRSGEMVRVEGQFDPQEVDRLGKPVYDVERMIRNVKR